ncbi:Endonuclease MutS2 [Acididesulfobacillus acetoxydans]|uniref:Endonuclease MutS2 n=1 Tax=Acididesulfobacillus acetoxydans TaxID=1561005 RepID=A0A8S0XAJ9_9FIRM|nr:endonuclease MutS2 [Acididesulfobacillus acetoxydans]CAA7599966.1 Endonuclease MutS2 [Acididesulfobacillus acetoxydans]CEJ07942.1 MutS2 protein [Acididesulfobacillus acetoxydans]
MTIMERTLKKLDFDRIRIRLAGLCLLKGAENRVAGLCPFVDKQSVRDALRETDQAKELLRLNPQFSVRGAKDIQPFLERCGLGAVLDPEELLQIRDTLKVARRVRQFLLEDKGDYSSLREIVYPIEPQRGLEDEITRCISEEGTVVDGASPELAQLRRSVLRLQQKIRESVESFLRNPAYQKMLQDPIVTQRAERYVVPVKQEYRAAFAGIVHDQSGSGATLFIEPMPVVHLGNELRETVLKEQREVLRILQQFSRDIGNCSAVLTVMYESLIRLDFVLAKARLSWEMNAGAPLLLDRAEVRLVQARHPLLGEGAVPLTAELGISFDSLVITGPNTGGKTVALKTIGLLVAMGQAGLHIPAEDGSRLGVFSRIFVDIGDEQSVEQSLSTFSGHMRNIVEVINEADGRSLVLLDEVGAGTDPTEGAALAMAVLEELHERGARVVATTHYGALKSFAYRTERVENASVDFDEATLRPTYRLLIGIPGKSNAFNIASRLGLKESVLAKAKTFLSERDLQMADLIENLEDSQRDIERERLRVREELRLAGEERRRLEQDRLRQAEEQRALLVRSRDEATEVIRQAKREAAAIVAELKNALKQEHKDAQEIEKARQRLRRLSDRLERMEEPMRPQGVGLKAEELKPGQTLYMTKLRQKGQILQLPDENGEVLLQAGIMKVSVPLAELRPVPEDKPKKKTGTGGAGGLGLHKAENVRSEVDLRGMLVEEATYQLDKYLDDAILAGIGQIYVIHGKGTGALRAGVQEFLRNHPHVRSFRLGQHGEGDFGVTVVELK